MITAAHCVSGRNETNMVVRAGQVNIRVGSESQQDRKIQKVIVHEKYNKDNLFNDIAVVILKTDFEMTESVSRICLPKQGNNYDGKVAIVSGFGKFKFNI